MPLSPDDVRRIARLAGVRLSRRDAARFAEQLSGMLSRIEALEESDLEDDATDVDGGEDAAPLRPEEHGADALEQPPTAFAPAWRDGFFTVPRVEGLGDEAAAADPGESGR